ncbi:MAG: glycosyltransferase [Phycisphaerales bacterium]|nr:glycosyltransferase [Phycisphaerales bacterium]
MRITLVNTHDVIGGAERCSHDLAIQLGALGHKTSLIVGRKLGSDPFTTQIQYPGLDWRLRALTHLKFGLTETTLTSPLHVVRTWPDFTRADLVNIHNMHGAYWNFWTLPLLARRVPVVLTLHDTWFMTGDCAYPYDCDRWRKGCGKCPQATADDPLDRVCIGGGDLTWLNLKLKRAAMRLTRAGRVALICPSRWIMRQAAASPHLRDVRAEHIEYGIDLHLCQPRDKAQARRALDLPVQGTYVFASAANLHDRRKNFALIEGALRSGAWPKGLTLVCVGEMNQQDRARFDGLPIRMLGFLGDRHAMAQAINACDAGLVVSRADNLPYSALELAACGRPVICTSVGGLPEIVDSRDMGWRLPADASQRDLIEALANLAEQTPEQLAARSVKIRRQAEARYDMNAFAAKTLALYEEMVA